MARATLARVRDEGVVRRGSPAMRSSTGRELKKASWCASWNFRERVGKSKTIGSGVVVPDFLYKIVIDDSTHQVLAFTFPQVDKQEIDLPRHLVSIATIEAATGISFPVPQGTDKTKPATAVWPVDLKKTADAKKAACKGAPGTDD